jgi:hypothetical protein
MYFIGTASSLGFTLVTIGGPGSGQGWITTAGPGCRGTAQWSTVRTRRLLTAARWLAVLVLLAAGALLVYLPFQRTHTQNRHAGWLLAHGDRVEATVHVTVTRNDDLRRRKTRTWSATYEYRDQPHEGPFSCGPCPADRAVIWIRVNPADPTDFVPESGDTSAGDDFVPGALFIAGLGVLALAFTAMLWPLRQR